MKKVARSTQETKRSINNPASYAVNFGQLGIINMVRNIPRGTDKGQRVGDQIFIKGIKMKYIVEPQSLDDTTTLSLAFIWTKQVFDDVGITTYANIFENITADPRLDVIDTEKVKILWRKDHFLKPHNTVQAMAPNFSKWLPINRSFKFFTDTNNQFTGGQYYLVLWAYSPIISTGKILDFKSIMYTYFKDA